MADDWEADDWESENFKPVLPAASSSKADQPSSGLAAGLDMSKFADEDADLEEEEDKHVVPASQPKKKEEKKYLKEVGPVDQPLDDPVAEKLRRQRLEEQADYAAAKDLFGEENQVNLDLFLPKSLKEFEDFAAAIANKYVVGHKESKNFKAFLKALVKAACGPLPSTEIKDIETSLAGLRAEKFKAEKAEADAKKGVRKHLNMGAKGKGGDSAGLDDYKYDDAGNGDDFDFM